MSSQQQAEKWQQVVDQIAQIGLVSGYQDEPRTAYQINGMKIHHLLQDLSHRTAKDGTEDKSRRTRIGCQWQLSRIVPVQPTTRCSNISYATVFVTTLTPRCSITESFH